MTPTTSLTRKERLLNAIAGKPVDRPPVWLMRQAGRYLPEYQAVKRGRTFLEMCRKPEIAAEISIQPLEIIGVDCVIVFNDILIPLEQMGMLVDFTDKGPVIAPPLREEHSIRQVKRGTFDETPPVFDSINSIRRQVGEDVPILGFAGAPFTLATYMVEGVTSKSLRYIKELRYARPDLLEMLLDCVTETVIDYLKIQAGANVVQIFDTWAGELSRQDYRRFALPFQQRVIQAIQNLGTPVILFVKGSTPVLSEMKASGAAILSVDWRLSLKEVSERLGDETVLQGNLDPTALYAPAETVSKLTTNLLNDTGRTTGHIFNLGHGVLPGTPVESVKALVETVKQYEYSSR